MPFAKAAPSAIRKPTSTSVVTSAFPKPIAAVDAISKFEGPANGIKLKAKPVKKIIMNSIITAIVFGTHLFLIQN
jgi:hypothetical protein